MGKINLNALKTKGVEINYYYICKRKLWFFSKGIALEDVSERVSIGALIHENSYPWEKRRNITINNTISIDVISDRIAEIKLTKSMEKASLMQLAYYLFYLKNIGIEIEGELRYPKERRVKKVFLTEEIEKELQETLEDIERIKGLASPPPANKMSSKCQKCAYFELCWAGE